MVSESTQPPRPRFPATDSTSVTERVVPDRPITFLTETRSENTLHEVRRLAAVERVLLETRVRALEQLVIQQRRQRQDVIDQYERVLAERERTLADRRRENESRNLTDRLRDAFDRSSK